MDQLYYMWDIISVLVIAGLMIGIVCAVIFGAIRIGWQLAPWIVVGAFVVWLLS
jgi:hypothetical protein|tara:strand:+ start:345 stop:506 length:162 start_codon:yes stop_codon:yes gene_type:complete